MNELFLIVTALTVSADAFFCAVSLSLGGGKKLSLLAGISCTVLCLCLASGLLGTVLSDVFSEEVTLVGGLILAAVGIYNLMGETTRINSRKSVYGQSLFVGIAVGLDGAVATLSLTMMGYSPILVAAIVTGAHALSVLAGISLSENVKLLKIRRIKALAPILLIALGIYKILSVFI